MRIHREGRGSIFVAINSFIILNLLSYIFIDSRYWWLQLVLLIGSTSIVGLIVSFFRIPNRQLLQGDNLVLAPCDGKVVVIEVVEPDEYFSDRRIQVSIFMSVLNVHVNRNPIEGNVVYSQYHKGEHLVAWHPKSSTANERHTVVYKHKNGREVLAKQIAGALANRIVNYLTVGKMARQSEEMGFIKFGSRVDLLLPLDAKIKVKLGDKAKSGITTIAEWE
ncbi:phosphatidylserine decarboxylase family protein [Myroides marinus]|uniref:Phosphatidylserine decarboxylase n=1 Tax=Myroides marinus TaxID=703342 RepID=A0A1H6TSX6_9FLAO|nr:phosphatidylserine decarboxylase family protein [Myroides marinus]MDM1380050.1 phosphatidylserine decarboxylase family protein [Myroides marinus]MDM1387293.1 phosphatidylserine decarboxylase family protein [Myroides marinus]MDM1394534.1 phosphatidylserine decarboxylase family protein [Myroides marinus]SEI80347.1 phosphatidylserine decarboxylase [Myroides marinus]